MPPPPPAVVTPAARIHGWQVWLHVWRIHRWLGLVLGALIVLLSATGSLLVVHHELERIFERDRHVTADQGIVAPLAPIIAELPRRAPADYRLHRLHPASAPDATHRFVFLGPDGQARWTAFVVPANGRVVWSGHDQTLFTPWLLGLHRQLHAGRAGYVLTGVAGIGLLLLGLTGLYLHRGRLHTLLRAPFRVHLGWRVALADLHKWVGVIALYFPVVLGLTGALYVWRILDAAPAPARPTAASAPVALSPLEPLLAAARARYPTAEILRVQFPAAATAPLTLLVLHRDAPPWQKFSHLEFDARDGRLLAVRDARERPAAQQFASLLAPLHFGFHGAPWVKWAYFVGGLAPGALALTGLALAWRRSEGRTKTPTRAARSVAPGGDHPVGQFHARRRRAHGDTSGPPGTWPEE